jgi:hypothetical protein
MNPSSTVEVVILSRLFRYNPSFFPHVYRRAVKPGSLPRTARRKAETSADAVGEALGLFWWNPLLHGQRSISVGDVFELSRPFVRQWTVNTLEIVPPAYSADCDRRFLSNVTGHSDGSALGGFLTPIGHDQTASAVTLPRNTHHPRTVPRWTEDRSLGSVQLAPPAALTCRETELLSFSRIWATIACASPVNLYRG